MFALALVNTAAGAQYSLVHTFAGAGDGVRGPNGLVLVGSMLYGASREGVSGVLGNDGAIFRISTDGSGFQLLRGLNAPSDDAAAPRGTLALGGSTLYGTTNGGYHPGHGSVFKINVDGSGFQLLHSFAGQPVDGESPWTGVTLGGTTLYGTTHYGGTLATSDGTIYKLNTDGTGYQLLHSFAKSSDGALPKGGLTLDGTTLYGTTADAGGAWKIGTVFKLNTDGTDFQVIHTFAGGALDGYGPQAALTLVGSVLYGTTYGGGASSLGTIFRMNTDGSDFQLLHSFAGGAIDGSRPQAELTLVGSTLYGTTYLGGASNLGTAFQINTDGSGFQLLHSFAGGTDGQSPSAPLTLVGSTLYGTTGSYQSGNGTIFAIAVPEPSSLALLAIGAVGLPTSAHFARRWKRLCKSLVEVGRTKPVQ